MKREWKKGKNDSQDYASQPETPQMHKNHNVTQKSFPLRRFPSRTRSPSDAFSGDQSSEQARSRLTQCRRVPIAHKFAL
jgi:hypothetical protein